MQACARGRMGERKTYHITMEFGGYLWIFIECPRAQERARTKRTGSYLPKSKRNFRQPPYDKT